MATDGPAMTGIHITVQLDPPTAALLATYIDRFSGGNLAELYMQGDEGTLSKGELDDLHTLAMNLLGGVSHP